MWHHTLMLRMNLSLTSWLREIAATPYWSYEKKTTQSATFLKALHAAKRRGGNRAALYIRHTVSLLKPLRIHSEKGVTLGAFSLWNICTPLTECRELRWQILGEGHSYSSARKDDPSPRLYKRDIEIITQGLPEWQNRVSSSPHTSSSMSGGPCCISQSPSGSKRGERKKKDNREVCLSLQSMDDWSQCPPITSDFNFEHTIHSKLCQIKYWLND